MTIVSKEFYAVKCDGCGKLFPEDSEYDEYAYWDDKNYAVQCAIEGDWLIDEQGDEYCPNCYDFDDDDNVVIKIHGGNK